MIAAKIVRDAVAYRDSAIVRYPNGVAQVDDSNPVSEVPDATRCALVTTALQHNEGSQVFIDFDRRLMNHSKNSQLSRAVLNLHEDLYAWGRVYYRLDNSRPVRDLIGEVLIPDHVRKTQFQLLDYIYNLFPKLEIYVDGSHNCHTYSASYYACKDELYLPAIAAPILKNILQEAQEKLVSFDKTNFKVVFDIFADKYRGMTYRQVVEWGNSYENARVETLLGAVREAWGKERAALVGDGTLNPSDPKQTLIAVLDAWVSLAQKVRIPTQSPPNDRPYYEILSEWTGTDSRREKKLTPSTFWRDAGLLAAFDQFAITSMPGNGLVTFPEVDFKHWDCSGNEIECWNENEYFGERFSRIELEFALKKILLAPNLPATLE